MRRDDIPRSSGPWTGRRPRVEAPWPPPLAAVMPAPAGRCAVGGGREGGKEEGREG